MLSLFMLLAGVLVVPVERVAADAPDYGPDGYFSTLGDGEMPMRSLTSETNARKVLFGRSGSLANAAKVVESGDAANVQVDGKYLMLGKGLNFSKNRRPRDSDGAAWATSATTSLINNEVLLWADDVVTSPFAFAAGTSCSGSPCNTFDAGTADADKKASYESYVARVSRQLGSDTYYSDFELGQVGAASQLNAVCVRSASSGCSGGYNASAPNGQGMSVGSYRVFPLSTGDMAEYFNANDGYITGDNTKRQCSAGSCNNSATNGSWLRYAGWDNVRNAFHVRNFGAPSGDYTNFAAIGLRPAFRLNLDRLLLSAHSKNQSQVLNEPNSAAPDSLRLTFVDAETSVVLTGKPTIEQESGVGGEWVLKDLQGSSNLDAQSGLGWKLVDPTDNSGGVVASGRTNYDAAAKSDGNMVVPCETLTPDKDYVLSVWGQEDGSDTVGWSNRATTPVTGTVTANGGGVCALDIKTSPSFDIALTGQTSGTLMAYKIGDYKDEVFDQNGALRSVRLDTSEGLGTVLKDAAVAAGSSGVDEDNPVGWVAAKWLGYPTDPSSDDVTSAFSPYAGRLQLFAQALRDAVKADGDALGEVAGQLNGLDAPVDSPVTLPVSGPGLYLIVDSSGTSLPIIVGTKVFNEALGDDGGFVDFADAGVKGKPRLGQAALKSDFADVYKRIVNDPGMDGFDVGSEVEYEIALRVPDLTKLDGVVSFGDYVFEVADVLPAGLDVTGTLASVRVFVGDAERTGDASVTLQDGRLTVSGLKALFAVAGSSPVVNDAGVVPVNGVVRIRYAAVLADGALLSKPGVDGLKPNANTVTLTRSTGPSATEEKTATANAYSFTVDVVKLDKDDLSTRLGGVGFEVSRDGQPLKFVGSDGVYRLAVAGETGSATTVTTKADGTLSLLGVEARELSFKETKAPSGYFKVSDFTVDIRPVWNADATQVTKVTYATSGTNLAYVSQDGRQVMVLDPAWSLANLPYTGGMGILVLLIVGGLMLVFAVRPYVLSKRAERDANLV
ncbi:SpaA isopeptide-forming pilin-related protein [Bifidobacterium crudilactis]|jgi:fimbrial isopeptide formation D2 family protein|uniref:SpaA isopeptide-forming pilin-related protein n=1 Tax=Bifidobacterium crudilactis TaxID=327277 RepID=UPI0023535CCE|nr:SpaA isopeptide-forming pilin-related protein [Bifidobacterium crudilactis]MCI2149441.1 hypothetical protein [Bifidobacterium crudilactis]MCI2157973.1 hypothetical protein [Bifidobacterium crudilactis]